MIQTSFFRNAINFPKGKRKVSISRFLPSWFQPDETALHLAPSKDLLLSYKEGKKGNGPIITHEEYTRRYKEETLSKLDPKIIAAEHKDSIFLCYETPDEFCHRHILGEWLKEAGFPVHEIKEQTRILIYGSHHIESMNELKEILDRFFFNFKDPYVSTWKSHLDLMDYIEEHDFPVCEKEYDIVLGFTDNLDDDSDLLKEVYGASIVSYVMNVNSGKWEWR